MLLTLDKEKLRSDLIPISPFYLLVLVIFLNFGFKLKESEPHSFLKELKNKLNVKINYYETPVQSDFFTSSENCEKPEKCIGIGSVEELGNLWRGKYDLVKESIFWVNPSLSKNKIYNLIHFGPYEISFRFKLLGEKRLSGVDVLQEGVKYYPANVEIANDKQINYWTKAMTENWLEIIRGKMFRKNEDELFTIFQTVVYEEKLPIYAFRGESVLKKSANGK